MRAPDNQEAGQDSRLGESVRTERSMPFTSPSLIAAARTNDVEKIRMILDGILKIHEGKSRGSLATALHHAAAMNSLDCVNLLIEKGSPLHARDYFGCTPLTIAALYGNVEVVRQFGWRIPRTDLVRMAEEALPFAALEGHTEVYKLLLKYIIGIDISRDPCGAKFLENVVLSTPHSMIDFVKSCITNQGVCIEEALQDPEIQYFLRKVLTLIVAFGAYPSIKEMFLLMKREYNEQRGLSSILGDAVGLFVPFVAAILASYGEKRRWAYYSIC